MKIIIKGNKNNANNGIDNPIIKALSKFKLNNSQIINFFSIIWSMVYLIKSYMVKREIYKC